MRKLLAVLLTLALLAPAACGFAEEGGVPFDDDVNIANPWTETTPEELFRVYGYAFAIPEGAEDIVYRVDDALQMAEMRFYIGMTELAARVVAMDPEDISGVYYEQWDVEERCRIDTCEGLVRRVTDEGRTIDVCLWYDAENGLTWSLVAEADDLDGFDITAVAEQVYMNAESVDESHATHEDTEEDTFESDWGSDEEAEEEDLYAYEGYEPEEAPETEEAEEYYGESDESEAYDHNEEAGEDESSEATETYYEEPAAAEQAED